MKKVSKLKMFANYYKPHMPLFITDMTCALLISAIDVAYPLFSKIALQQYLPQGRYQAFFMVVAIALIAYILRALMQYIVTSLGHRLGVLMEADMRRDVFSHLQKLSFSFFDKSRTGVLMARCTHDLFEITELAHHGPEDVFVSVLTLLGAFIVMLTIEWRLALVLMLLVPIFLLTIVLLRNRMSKTSSEVKEGLATINSDIESSLSGMRVAQAFTNEEYEIKKFQRGNNIYIKSRRGFYTVMAQLNSAMELFTTVLNVVVLGVGGYMIMTGDMDIVVLMTFTLYVSSFTNPIKKLSNFAETYTMGMAGFKRFVELMGIDPDIEDTPDATDIIDVKGDISFKNVSFAYDNKEEVLTDVNLDIRSGCTIALVGPSGGGKTTICHLLPRFYEPNEGCICVDGKDIRNITKHSLREHIGIVQQDVFMFADTIRENIRYGRICAQDADIIAAAKAAEIHDDIMAMPNGYDTVVGERGLTLSGGQKQRISIARIFLKNPPILILDEATSALDSATEAKINAAFERLSLGRTTLIIAHRLSTIRNADTIIVIDGGRIIESGTHKELLEKNGEYAKLHAAQMV
ncbi:MAG: ABC transporter ATP-binding protein [Clostridia bacterium]